MIGGIDGSKYFSPANTGGPRIKVPVTNDMKILTRVVYISYICHTRVFDVSECGGRGDGVCSDAGYEALILVKTFLDSTDSGDRFVVG